MSVRALLAAATPRPWFHVGQPWARHAGLIVSGDEDPHAGVYVGDLEAPTWRPAGEVAGDLAADCDLIVRAVNEYERLRELLQAAQVFISHFVPVEDALINGFSVESWCSDVEALVGEIE